eukprot:6682055-Alexandrium_andersonii.AAC.1
MRPRPWQGGRAARREARAFARRVRAVLPRARVPRCRRLVFVRGGAPGARAPSMPEARALRSRTRGL